MANPLLDRVLPAELADSAQIIEYKGIVGDFERLSEISAAELTKATGAQQTREWRDLPVETRLQFGWLDTSCEFAAATGQIRAVLPLVCQRCLEAFELVVETPVKILFGEAGDVADNAGFDAWEVDEAAIVLQDVVEESIVMALPLAPLHDSDTACGVLAEQIPETGPEKTLPFADLKSWMATKDN